MAEKEPEQWIVVRNWERFQHYKDRTPNWIKIYTELLHDHAWLSLTWAERGILSGIWMMYASSRLACTRSTVQVLSTSGRRITDVQLERLNHAGFIEFSASKPLAFTRSREKDPKGSFQEGASATSADAGGAYAPREEKEPAELPTAQVSEPGQNGNGNHDEAAREEALRWLHKNLER